MAASVFLGPMEPSEDEVLGATLVLQSQYRRWNASRRVGKIRQRRSDDAFALKLTKLRERLEVRSCAVHVYNPSWVQSPVQQSC